MEEKILKQSIQRLNISENAIKLLNEKSINTIEKLTKKSKMNLKSIGILPNEVNKIETELQLLGLNLRNSL